MVYLDYPVNKDIGVSYGSRKWIFAQDVWEAQNPVDVLSVLPLNVREIMKDFYICKRPLNVMWAFLRMTIGLPIGLVIKILQTDHGWKIFVPRPIISIQVQLLNIISNKSRCVCFKPRLD